MHVFGFFYTFTAQFMLTMTWKTHVIMLTISRDFQKIDSFQHNVSLQPDTLPTTVTDLYCVKQ